MDRRLDEPTLWCFFWSKFISNKASLAVEWIKTWIWIIVDIFPAWKHETRPTNNSFIVTTTCSDNGSVSKMKSETIFDLPGVKVEVVASWFSWSCPVVSSLLLQKLLQPARFSTCCLVCSLQPGLKRFQGPCMSPCHQTLLLLAADWSRALSIGFLLSFLWPVGPTLSFCRFLHRDWTAAA